jgi:hypothetical protein
MRRYVQLVGHVANVGHVRYVACWTYGACGACVLVWGRFKIPPLW